MALPTITGISPGTIWTAGQLLAITGTNFKTWTIPSSSSAVLPAPTPTVQVTVDGAPCSNVLVFSATRLTCMAPVHDPATVNVIVTNLDVDGVPIVGESSTPSALIYVRPDLTAVQDLERVNAQVIAELRRQILDNVVLFVSTDYAEAPFDVAAIGALPALVLSGPTIVESENVYVRNEEIEVGGYPDTSFESLRAPKVVNLEYDLSVLTDNTRQLNNLQAIVYRFFYKNTKFSILRDAADPSKGYITYELEKLNGNALRATTTPNKNNVRSFDVSFRVLGVPVEGLGGFTKENLVSSGGGVVDDIVTVSVKL